MNSRIGFALSLAFFASVALADRWEHLDDANWYSGPKLTEQSLVGKVVMVDEWGSQCPPCRKLLPRMEQIWQSFKSKPFVLIGSHRQERNPEEVKRLVSEHKLTYPIYDRVGLAGGEPDNEGAVPFIYVVDHRGKVVYAGRSDREATEALVEAITKVGLPPDLLPGVTLIKYKSLSKQIVLGKSISQVVKTLKKDVAAAGRKSATQAQKDKAEEAAKILDAIEIGRTDVAEEIEAIEKSDPEKCLKLVNAFVKTFPDAADKYKGKVAELTELLKAKNTKERK